MAIVQTFESRGQARNGRTYLALGLGMAALYYGLAHEATLLLPVLAAIYVALILLRLVLNPMRGFRVGERRLSWFTGLRRHSMNYDDLAGVAIGRSPAGRTICVVTMLDGHTVALPGVERVDPSKLMREFGRHGVRITG